MGSADEQDWDDVEALREALREELRHPGLPEGVVAAAAYQILQGLAFLHASNQLHRDVKPSNILISTKGEVKLTDFGIARELDHAGAMVDTVVGTVRYMSPERLQGEAYGAAADLWGLGLVLLECVTQEPPYADGCSQIEILQTLKEHGGEVLLPQGLDRAGLSNTFLDIVSRCLKVEPAERIRTEELLASKWFHEHGVQNRETAMNILADYMDNLYM